VQYYSRERIMQQDLTHQHGRSNRLIRLLLSTTAVAICFNGVVTQNLFAEEIF
jgi:hypothetical protein